MMVIITCGDKYKIIMLFVHQACNPKIWRNLSSINKEEQKMATEFQISTELPPEVKAGRKLIRLLKTIVKRGQLVKKRVLQPSGFKDS